MKKSLDQVKCLIVEDDQEKREQLVKEMRNLGFNLNNIERTKYAEKAIEKINDELPDVVLLDLNIPYSEDNEKIEINNSNKVIEAVKSINLTRNLSDESTGIIIVSASIDDKGMRNRYKGSPEIVDYIDKYEMAINPQGFAKNLNKQINKVLERKFSQPCLIDFKEIKLSNMKPLEKTHPALYDRIINELFAPLSKLNNRDVNVHHVSNSIISAAGKIVEDIINITLHERPNLTSANINENHMTIRHKLTQLTGRKWDYETKEYIITGSPVFSRKAAEYAQIAYKLRSEAAHSTEADEKNEKLFADCKFTTEDAVIASTLVLPLILEFIQHKTNS